MTVEISRPDVPVKDMRRTTARGTIVNSGFDIGLAGLGAIQRLVVASFITVTAFGVWTVILNVLVTLAWLRDLGIADKYVQQSERDQEAAFQKAFTLEVAVSLAFVLLVALALPVAAVAYGRPEIILPGLLAALVVPLTAFEAPAWVPYRRLQYARHRALTAVNPLTVFAVTVGLAIAGAGYWSFVAGALAGSVAGAIACTATTPYPLRLRFDRSTLREYTSFSWPLVLSGVSMLILVQGTTLVAASVVGIAGVGLIALATSIAVFADRVDAIVSATIYPAVCAVVDRTELLAEAFTKSNRVALIWAAPFGVGLALFAGDLVHFVLGERWEPAIGLLAAFGLTCALGQVAFNWTVFLRAVNNTRPILVGTVIYVAVFLAVAIPGMYEFGVGGFAAGFASATVAQIAFRGYYMRTLFRGFNVFRQMLRAVVPVVPGTAVILVERQLAHGDRSPARAVVELAIFSAAAVVFTYLFERRLIVELAGYLRARPRSSPVGAPTAGPV